MSKITTFIAAILVLIVCVLGAYTNGYNKGATAAMDCARVDTESQTENWYFIDFPTFDEERLVEVGK